MKQTEYFLGTIKNTNEILDSINEAKKLRDDFIKENSVAKIDIESIQIVSYRNGTAVQALITFSYYLQNQ
jgi:hypothetical protein